MRRSKRKLKHYINELCSMARQLFPGAKVRVKKPYETEDADIIVELPINWKGKTARKLDLLIQRKLDILIETGYDIVVFVEKPNRRKDGGNKARKAKTSATR
ncbi:MAG: hypothetical protein LKKZDAJK_002845 [Candidatus Fervidibacter sp.]